MVVRSRICHLWSTAADANLLLGPTALELAIVHSCLIVGGGLIGRSVAYYLSRAGIHVVLVCEEDPARIQSAPTRASLGVLTRPTAGLDSLSAFYRLSHELYDPLARQLAEETGVDIGWTACGGLEVAYNEQEALRLRAHVSRLQERGARCQWLSPIAAAEREPALALGMIAACLWPQDHRVDPQQLAKALWLGALRHGARHHPGHVAHLDGTDPPAIVLETGEKLTADTVVLAAGAATSALGVNLGLAPRAVRSAAGQSLQLQASVHLQGIVHWEGYHLLPTSTGDLFVGATNDPATAYDLSDPVQPTEQGRQELLEVAERVLGHSCNVVQHNAGLRPKPRRGRALIAPLQPPGYYVASGHYKNGVLMAPATGQALTAWITEGDPGVDMTPFAIER
ncbi:MAG: FAD-binding oxidoreductase [Gemmatimonadetes bacterium]|nr:FAD-binding oxidoreductase [Gemmatimonadota bacterium]MBT5058018.1 FAD-binding oxidoreductase [Gemmatimonadota bacterium]MBT5141679.1 FAD-binding oxidoreductase [Gemmatimonadota bacterium]MBT5590982.1 FAD-binding oxidoreductase [Gemmatimonadota bacterium]MBT5964954.1 FAD-binding oxidoreductase [Gemmatimonadota bacterium]